MIVINLFDRNFMLLQIVRAVREIVTQPYPFVSCIVSVALFKISD